MFPTSGGVSRALPLRIKFYGFTRLAGGVGDLMARLPLKALDFQRATEEWAAPCSTKSNMLSQIVLDYIEIASNPPQKTPKNLSGKRAALPPPAPLRTGHESFPSSGSSRYKAPRERSRCHDGYPGMAPLRYALAAS